MMTNFLLLLILLILIAIGTILYEAFDEKIHLGGIVFGGICIFILGLFLLWVLKDKVPLWEYLRMFLTQ